MTDPKKNGVFHVRLNSIMDLRGITVKYITERLDVSRATVSRWRGGGGSPRGKTLRDLADALSTTMAFLLGESDDPSPSMGDMRSRRWKDNPGRPFDMMPFSIALSEAIMQNMNATQKEQSIKVLSMAIDAIAGKSEGDE